VDITVTTPSGASATSTADLFTYTSAPTVTAISPATGPIQSGSSITLTGTNFTPTATVIASPSTVNIGTVTVLSSTSLTFTVSYSGLSVASAVGQLAVPVHFSVVTPSGTSPQVAADIFIFTSAPTVTSVSPATGPTTGGTVVTITGADFTGATAVNFGTTAATTFTVNSATQIVATSPVASATGTVDITVTNGGGTSPVTTADRFVYSAVVPTMGEWFMALLSSILVGLGYMRLRRRTELPL